MVVFATAGLLFLFVTSCQHECRGSRAVDAGESGHPDHARVWESEFAGQGLLEWMSPYDGRFVVLRAFDSDTDGDGVIDVRVGQHGEVEADEPTLWLLDTREETRRRIEAIVGLGAHRWLGFVEEGGYRVLNSGSGHVTSLEEVETSPDSNPCLGPRGLSISADGTGVAVLESGGQVSLGSPAALDALRSVELKGRVWRLESLSSEWARVRVVEPKAEFPVSRTTCVCDWCARLATSLGNYGFEGKWRELLVNRSGAWVDVDDLGRDFTVLTDGHIYSARRGLMRLVESGSLHPVAPELSRDFVATLEGASGIVVRDDGLSLLDLTTGRPTPLASELRVRRGVYQHGRDAFMSRLLVRHTEGRALRYASLDLNSADLHLGPVGHRAGPVHSSGWVLVAGRDSVSAFHLETGEVNRLGAYGVSEIGALTFTERGVRYAVDPDQAGVWAPGLPFKRLTQTGCVLTQDNTRRASARGIERGPWRLVCPPDR